MIILTNTLIPKGFDAITIWPFIFSRNSNQGLIQHELVHYNEMKWITPIWWFRYAFSKKFRIAAEVRAYAASMQCGMQLETAATWLLKYDNNLTREAALSLLVNKGKI